jgi:hypothetical protein
MLEDVLAKWNGMTRWPQTVEVTDGRYDDGPPAARIAFYYRDANQSLQSGELTPDSLSALYNLRVNDTFAIQFNPRNPVEFYLPEIATWFTQFRIFFWIGVACLSSLSRQFCYRGIDRFEPAAAMTENRHVRKPQDLRMLLLVKAQSQNRLIARLDSPPVHEG